MIEAKYTEVLKNLLDNEQTKPLIDKALSTYPLYKQKTEGEYIPVHIPTREELNNAILNYYKYREIGFETVGRFLDELETAMCEIMPYYNQRYFSVDQDYNILENANYIREIEREREKTDEKSIEGSEEGTGTNRQTTASEGSETGSNTSESFSEGSEEGSTTSTSSTTAQDSTTTNSSGTITNKQIESQTPQGQLSITAENIDNVDYADKVVWNKDGSTSTGTTTGASSTSGTGSGTNEKSSILENNTSQNSTIEKEENTTVNGSTTENKSNKIDSDGQENEKESTVEKLRGNYGMVTYQSLIEKYRDLIINVTQEIIKDKRIQELFMLVY